MKVIRILAVLGGAMIAAPAAAPILAAESAPAPASGIETPPAPVTRAQMREGSEVYHQICFACHQLSGRGIPGTYPPLAGSQILLHQRTRVISILLHGLQGPVEVKGKSYNNVMPMLNLSDQQIADVMTYALNSWGNQGGAVTVKTVAQERSLLAHHPEKAPPAPPQGGMMAGGGMMGGHGMMGSGGGPAGGRSN